MKSEDVMTAIVPASRRCSGWRRLGRGSPARAHRRELAGRYPAAGGVTLSPWAGLSIICGYAVVLLLAGGWLLSRRDA
jgi:hypothetical protein